VPPRAVGCDFVRPVEQLGVYSVAHDQAINMILARTTAFVALDAQNGELTNDVTECDRAVAGHHNHPSTRNRSKSISLSSSPNR
jgi:hypothetical protein